MVPDTFSAAARRLNADSDLTAPIEFAARLADTDRLAKTSAPHWFPGDAGVKRYLKFMAIGSFFATVEEYLTVVVLRNDVGSYIFTLIVLFPVYLTIVYLLGRVIDRTVRREGVREFVHFQTFGSIGLLLEWFLMGLAPWSDPKANPVLMLIFQMGMFAFWTTVATAPRVFLDPRAPSRVATRRILWFYIPFFTLVYCALPSIPPARRFATLIPLILVAYLVVAGILVARIIAFYADRPAALSEAKGPGKALADDF